jgi:hypothetical protein
MYIPIESSPNDQIPPELFASINSTDIYISSNKFVMNGAISMEVYSIHSHCHDDVISILNILKNFGLIARYRAPPRHVLKNSQ